MCILFKIKTIARIIIKILIKKFAIPRIELSCCFVILVYLLGLFLFVRSDTRQNWRLLMSSTTSSNFAPSATRNSMSSQAFLRLESSS